MTLRVPLVDLAREYAEIRDEVRKAIDGVLESQRFVLGPEVDALEAELSALCEVRHTIGCSSGSDALVLALAALGVGPGDQVLCPAFTFFASAGAVARLGATPVFADIEPASFTLDPEAAREAAAHCTRLRALIPVHLYGRAADLAALETLAAELGVPLVEDAAQAVASRDETGRRIGGRGRVACFSCFPTKNLGAFGEAGFLTTDDDELAEHLRRARVHGGRDRYYHEFIGMNARLDALQAAVLRVKLGRLERWLEIRRANAAAYDAAFAELAEVRTPEPPPAPALHTYHQYAVRVPADRRSALQAHLAEQGIGSDVYYPLGLHLQPCFAGLGYREGDLPHTEAASAEVLSLPVHIGVGETERRLVIDAVHRFFAA